MTNWYPDKTSLYEDVQTRNQHPDWPEEKRLALYHRASRDSARTPVQWTGGENAGFTTGTPWFYVNENYPEINVEQALADPDSILNFYKKAIALRKLADNGYDKTADLCEKRVAESPYGPVRLEALRLMSTSRSPRFNAMLVQAAGDSYELVRRLVSQWIGDCGDDELVPAAVEMLLDDELSLRVAYHADENMMFMNPDAVSAELRRQSAAKHELYQNEESLQKRLKRIADKQAEQTETFKFIRDPQNKMKRRLSEITYFRLYRHHYCVPELIALAEDAALEEPLRVAAVEALGWFGRSYQRPIISAMCERLLQSEQPRTIFEQTQRTSKRLEAY